MIPITILIVVDSNPAVSHGFTWGASPKDQYFTLHTLVSTLQTQGNIIVDTAHRDGDVNATFQNAFNFSTSIPDLAAYDEIWLFGYDGSNGNLSPGSSISDEEVAVIAAYMQSGGGIFATGDHAGLGSLMCGKIPRVRSMRKWYQDGDADLPNGAPANWPGGGSDRADTLVIGHAGEWYFDNQSDDQPQTLSFPGGVVHPILNGSNGPISNFPDHMHEGEVLGFGGISGPGLRTPWTVDETITIGGLNVVEYPVVQGHQEIPTIIATGLVTGSHTTIIEQTAMGCENSNFSSDSNPVTGKQINILSVYDGHNANVGRILTDSSFHHYLDLNLTGDPCSTGAKTVGFGTPEGQPYFLAMQDYYVNVANWLRGPQFSSITCTSPDGAIPTAFFTHSDDPLQQALMVPTTNNPSGPTAWTVFDNLPGQPVQRGSGITSLTISKTDIRVYYTNQASSITETIWNDSTSPDPQYTNNILPSSEVRSGSSLTSLQTTVTRVYYVDNTNTVNELSLSSAAASTWVNTALPSGQVRTDSPLTALSLPNGDPRIYYIDTQDQINELAWVDIGTPGWVNTILPTAFPTQAPLVATYSGLACFALNGTDSRVYYSGRASRLSAFNWVDDAWENIELSLPGPAGFVTMPMGGAMVAFQDGTDPHIVVIQEDALLGEVQPFSGTGFPGAWQVGEVSGTAVRQPGSMCLLELAGGVRKIFFVGIDARIYVATWDGGSWGTVVISL
jgi:hypothetical protein